ncbi:hypothetical protein AB0H36_32730 [Kribbella sp. NPDC050820]|uniref:hypothetical protein n=1 Tax=Kribbella sp. NPDC050820 TaxID=3155408 RepID=UPI0034088322
MTDPAEILAQRDAVIVEFRKLAAGTQDIVALHYDGYSNAEIAEIKAKTVKAIERTLERWRARQRKLRSRGRDGRL